MKISTVKKFSPKDLQALDKFLRTQANDMSLVKAHGFITAIVSFPDLFMPSEWIPILVGDVKFYHDQTPVSIMLEKLITMYRQVNSSLNSDRKFELILSAQQPNLTIDQAPYSAIKEWCNGYCLALVWNEEEWLHAKENFVTKACATFFMLTDLIDNNKASPELADEWQKDKCTLVKNLPDLVKALYTYWLGEQRSIMARDLQAMRHSPCPCGSQRQYRNCCLLEAADASLH